MNHYPELWTMLKGICLALLLVLLVGACACSSAGQRTAENDMTDISKAVITLKRSICFGECPAYSLTVYGDGRVEYVGDMFVRVEGRQESTIPTERVEELVQAFLDADYFNLDDEYRDDSVADAPSATTSLSIGGRFKQVYHYFGDFDAPEILTELENKIDEISNSAQWVKRRQ